jgi:WD40 repeat protein
MGADFVWQPDSRHLLATYQTTSNGASPGPPMKFYNWDTLTGQQTLITSEAQVGRFLTTPDGRYLLVYCSDNRTVDVWQTSSESKVATFVTPNEPTSPYVFTYNDNQELIIVQKDTVDIWDIATGKLIYQYHGPTPFSSYGAGGSIIFWSPDNKYLVMLAWKQTSSIGDASLFIWRNP